MKRSRIERLRFDFQTVLCRNSTTENQVQEVALVLSKMSSPAVEGVVDHILEACDEDCILYLVLQISELGLGGPLTDTELVERS